MFYVVLQSISLTVTSIIMGENHLQVVARPSQTLLKRKPDCVGIELTVTTLVISNWHLMRLPTKHKINVSVKSYLRVSIVKHVVWSFPTKSSSPIMAYMIITNITRRAIWSKGTIARRMELSTTCKPVKRKIGNTMMVFLKSQTI